MHKSIQNNKTNNRRAYNLFAISEENATFLPPLEQCSAGKFFWILDFGEGGETTTAQHSTTAAQHHPATPCLHRGIKQNSGSSHQTSSSNFSHGLLSQIEKFRFRGWRWGPCVPGGDRSGRKWTEASGKFWGGKSKVDFGPFLASGHNDRPLPSQKKWPKAQATSWLVQGQKTGHPEASLASDTHPCNIQVQNSSQS